MSRDKKIYKVGIVNFNIKKRKMAKIDWEEIFLSLISIVFGIVGVVGLLSTLTEFKGNLLTLDALLLLSLSSLLIAISFIIFKRLGED